MICTLCPRNCRAERRDDAGGGVCGVGALPKIARAGLHMWEEPCISGTRGSGAVFFSGCGLRCIFCQNEAISHGGEGEVVSAQRLAEIFHELEAEGDAMLNKEGVAENIRAFEWAIDMRYDRQNYEITVPLKGRSLTPETLAEAIEDFHTAHMRAYGYRNDNGRIKLVSYRVSAIGVIEKPELQAYPLDPDAAQPKPFTTRKVLFQREKDFIETGIYHRDDFVPGTTLHGPAIIEQMDTTIVIPPRWVVETDGFLNLKAVYKEVNE